METALRASETIFSNFMEYSPNYVFFKDENIRSLRLRRNFEKMLGKPLDQLLGKNMFELFPSELAKSMVEDDKRVLREGKVVNVEEELNGRKYLTVKFPIVIDGKPRFLAGYTTDITEQKQVEEALKYRNRISATPSTVPPWVFILQPRHGRRCMPIRPSWISSVIKI